MKPVHAIVRLFNRLQDRFRRARAGSVLILVVALLVLMALLGTAFISTARIDRYGAVQNAANTEIDLLVEGVKNLVTGAILDDLRDGTGVYRPYDQPGVSLTNFEDNDSNIVDLYLAARVPTPVGGFANWRSVSWPLIQNGAAVGAYQFESPDTSAPYTLAPLAAPAPPKAGYSFQPTSGTFAGVPNWPFLQVRVGNAPNGAPIPAADVDGDGIADAGLWKLPISPIDGITYYAATRVIDNNSAVNGSLAWTPNAGAGGFAIAGNSFFPSDINFQGMLIGSAVNQATAMTKLNIYRAGDATAIPPGPVADGAPAAQTPTARNDFEFASQTDALWQQLGRRLDYPGYKTAAGIKYQSVPFAASASLAYRFCLHNQYGIPSVFEQPATNPELAASYVGGTVQQSPYVSSAAGITTWFNDNFAYTPAATPSAIPMRALTVARNPVANARPSHSVQAPSFPGQAGFRGDWIAGGTYIFGDFVKATDGRTYLCTQNHNSTAANAPTAAAAGATLLWEPVPWTDQPLKACINTAGFGELWHAFWDVMVEVPTGAAAGTPPTAPVRPTLGMFRDISRDIRVPASTAVALNAYMVMQLRSALAAVNAMDLRDSDNEVTSRTIGLFSTPIAAAPSYYATVFGTEAQPYITEMYVYTGGTAGYIAMELHNPYPFPIEMTNWRLVSMDRSSGVGPTARPPVELIIDDGSGTSVGERMAAPTSLIGSTMIPANGYVILESDQTARPPLLTAALTARFGAAIPIASAPGLNTAFNREITLVRPRRFDGQLAASTLGGNQFQEGTPMPDALSLNAPVGYMGPADQVDLTNVLLETGLGNVWNYRRGSGTTAGFGPWQFTSADSAAAQDVVGQFNPKPTVATAIHHAGLYMSGPVGTDNGNLGAADRAFAAGPPVADAATFRSFSVQLANVDFGGPNKMMDPATPAQTPEAIPHHFPFGAFARNGDILQVPFCGSYIIREPGDQPMEIREWNAVTMDILFADDAFRAPAPNNNDPAPGDTGLVADAREQLGRFCPVGNPRTGTGDFGNVVAQWTHRWAMDLFDHLTVQAPNDDYMPDVDPSGTGTEYDALPGPSPAKYPQWAGYPNPPVPPPIANAKYSEANDYDPDPTINTNVIPPEGTKVPVEGLININTAPWKVLAALPLRPGTQAQIDQLAQDIVAYRDSVTAPGAPFQTIYDLYKVQEFSDVQDAGLTAGEPNDIDGDFSPLGGTGTTLVDNVRFDFEERFVLLNRISNMITTRSDSYTVYLLVQGWQDAGTANPQLRTQRRLAFIVDRSRVNPTAPTLTVTPVPNN